MQTIFTVPLLPPGAIGWHRVVAISLDMKYQDVKREWVAASWPKCGPYTRPREVRPMGRGVWAAAAAAVLFWLAGCAATGPKGSEISSLNPLPPGHGRIVFLRSDSMVGAAIQPDIRLDGTVVGQSKPGGFFHVDVLPGRRVASATTEANSSLAVDVVAGQTLYVRSAIGVGLFVGRVTLALEHPASAHAELPDLRYTGAAPVRVGGSWLATEPSAGAASAATRAGQLKVGDRVVYRVTDRLTGVSRDAIYVVDRVSTDRVEFNRGGRVEAKDGSVVSIETPIAGMMDRCSPPGGWVRPGMTSGMVWTSESARSMGSACAGQLTLKARVVFEGAAATPFGEMTVQRVDFEGNLVNPGSRGMSNFKVTARASYAPQVGRIVRFESEVTGLGGGPDRELVELIEISGS